MTLDAHKSTFPVALGVRLTGVDDSCFSQTGESYSMIAMPNADSHNARVLQEDNTDLAYEFARKFRTLAPSRATACPTLLTRTASPPQRGTPRRTWTRREFTRSPRGASASSPRTTPWCPRSPRMRELRPLSPCPLPCLLTPLALLPRQREVADGRDIDDAVRPAPLKPRSLCSRLCLLTHASRALTARAL